MCLPDVFSVLVEHISEPIVQVSTFSPAQLASELEALEEPAYTVGVDNELETDRLGFFGQRNNDSASTTAKPVMPTNVSITVQTRSVCCSDMPR